MTKVQEKRRTEMNENFPPMSEQEHSRASKIADTLTLNQVIALVQRCRRLSGHPVNMENEKFHQEICLLASHFKSRGLGFVDSVAIMVSLSVSVLAQIIEEVKEDDKG